MKKVFAGKDAKIEVSKLFFAQTQPFAEVYGSRMYFQNFTAYSYGRHFPLAVISPKLKVCVVNVERRSNTTAKHQGAILNVGKNLMGWRIFEVPNLAAYTNETDIVNFEVHRELFVTTLVQNMLNTIQELEFKERSIERKGTKKHSAVVYQIEKAVSTMLGLIPAFNLDKEHFYTAFMNDNLIGNEYKEALRANWGKFPTFPN